MKFENDAQRIEELERRLRRAQKRADDAWNIALGAVFLAVLFKFGVWGVIFAVLIMVLIAKGRQMSK